MELKMKQNERAMVMESAAQVSGDARKWNGNGGSYKRIALVIVDITELARLGQDSPKMISTRARGLVQIVDEYSAIWCGKTEKSAGAQALAKLEEQAQKLNSQKETEVKKISKQLRQMEEEAALLHAQGRHTSASKIQSEIADLIRQTVKISGLGREFGESVADYQSSAVLWKSRQMETAKKRILAGEFDED